ncbi:MAG TPA: hypothetical protein VNG90_00245 [Candidatus Acidoferrum sp.]|nr:hypothetical protein [Candidatus Acidoferrum sp.]
MRFTQSPFGVTASEENHIIVNAQGEQIFALKGADLAQLADVSDLLDILDPPAELVPARYGATGLEHDKFVPTNLVYDGHRAWLIEKHDTSTYTKGNWAGGGVGVSSSSYPVGGFWLNEQGAQDWVAALASHPFVLWHRSLEQLLPADAEPSTWEGVAVVEEYFQESDKRDTCVEQVYWLKFGRLLKKPAIKPRPDLVAMRSWGDAWQVALTGGERAWFEGLVLAELPEGAVGPNHHGRYFLKRSALPQ